VTCCGACSKGRSDRLTTTPASCWTCTRVSCPARTRCAGTRRVRRSTWSSSAPAPAGRCWRNGWPGTVGRSSSWRPARSGTRMRTGSPTRRARTSCTGRRNGSSAAPTRSSWARTTPAAASAVRWSTTPATPPASTPRIFPPSPTTGSARTGRSATRTCGRTTSRSRPNYPSPGRTGPGAFRTATPSPRTRSPGRPPGCGKAPAVLASRCGSVRSGSSTAPSATARTASTAATACRAARSTPRPARTSPTYRMRWPTRWRSGPTPWPPASNSTRRPGVRSAWCITTRSAAPKSCSGPGSSRSPATPSKPPGCCSTPPRAAFRTGWATPRIRSVGT